MKTIQKLRSVDDLFVGGGELGRLMRAHDWAATPLGPAEDWPQSLRSVVRMMLTSRYQMWMAWGPELSFLYNDAYAPTLGAKHPHILAHPASEVWREIWPEIGPLIDGVLTTGEATYNEGMLLLLERRGYPEETYHTFSYSPLFGDDGAIAGMLCVVMEESERVINERRLETLRKLAEATSTAKTEADVFATVAAQLEDNRSDLPFTLTYLFEAGGRTARLAARSGIAADHPAAVETLEAGASPWPIPAADGAAEPTLAAELHARFTALPTGVWSGPPREALIAPIAQQGQEKSTAGFVIAGLNPHRALDQNYRSFIELIAGQIGATLANARAYEAERERARALAEIDRAKTTFFSNVSHEFRTPLTLMLAPLEALLTGEADSPEAARAQAAMAHRNGVRLLRLVNNLLDFSRIESGRIQAHYQPTDLAAFSADIAAGFRSAVEQAGLTFSVVCEDLVQPVYVDREMWEKILLNLLSNAFKFTLEGEIRVSVRRAADGDAAEIRVADTGVGVPEAELPRLFERFHRVAGAQGRSFEGSGIGLALVLELVKLHGGAIGVESVLGRGTTFTLRLPFGTDHLPAGRIDLREDAARPSNAQAYVEDALRWLPDIHKDLPVPEASIGAELGASASARIGAGKTVLLADDNADMRTYVGRLLAGQGYTVTAVENGERALEAMRETPPDLVLTDVMMPVLDGFGLLRAIRADPNLVGAPVVMLSARAGEEAKIEGLDAGADDYLVKPFSARELVARVNANIQMVETRREAARAIMRSEQRYLLTAERLSLALSTGRVSVFEWDIDADHLVMHGPLAEAYGIDPADALKGLPRDAYVRALDPADLERVQAASRAAVEHGVPYEVEYRVHARGETRMILARGRLDSAGEGGPRLTGALIDITEEKAAQLALQALNAGLEERVAAEIANRMQAEEALRQAQKMEAVGQLTGGVAHDFNNLLTLIIGGLDTIRRSSPDDTVRIRRSVDMAMQGAQRAASLTSRLLAFSRRQPLEPRPLDLNVLVRDMTELLHRTLGEAIELEGVMAPRLWRVEADQNQLENAIINLAVNARDAMPDGGKLTLETANASIDEAYSAANAEVTPGQYVMVAVSDSGCGMPKEALDRAFEPFFTTKEVGKGTGLGLSQVYGFVKQSGGHVAIYSEPGHGTTVKLYFPRFRGAGPEVEAAVENPPPRASREEVILVVEDNDDVRAYGVMILSELGYRVLDAADADTALAILDGPARVDLLFTDVVLPGKTGRVLADAAKLKRPDLPVLFTTGYSRNAIVHQGRLDPGVHLIGKPFTIEELANRVRDVLDRT
jgi:signal transduction histidine kinase/DNA-binding response OmpR family regulator